MFKVDLDSGSFCENLNTSQPLETALAANKMTTATTVMTFGDLDGINECAAPAPTVPRHWMLDVPQARDLLKSALRHVEPKRRVSALRADPSLDADLEKMVDRLNMRDLPSPATAKERCKRLWKFVLMTISGSYKPLID